ncbi:MAG: YceI family protein [Weeksellaceae bacterium]|nr:YceI family protein [Weeksellaceae bacterium]
MKKFLILCLCSASFLSCKNETRTAVTPATTQDTVTTAVTDTVAEYGAYRFNTSATQIKWTAYKTEDKVGVPGRFTDFTLSGSKESTVKEEVLEGATFRINTQSMTTDDESRDAKIIGLFFNNLSTPTITGSFGKFENGVVPITLRMNDVEATKNFQYTFENRKVIITGMVDVLEDFSANSAYEILHAACRDLHQNKTWTEVTVEVITNM